MSREPAMLVVGELTTTLDTPAGSLRAVDGVDFELHRGECFALVGESGCGKSMTALSIMRLLPETGRIANGRVLLDGHDLLALPEAAMRAVRGRRVAMIFQEPATALNAVLTVGHQIVEVIERHTPFGGPAARRRALELLEAVGIPEPARRYDEYPFQLSGGLKQRVMIAAALAVEPEVLIADEPTTAVDVTIQAQILDLLKKLQAERGMALLLITHDLGIVAQMAQRVAVMYAGQIVEIADRESFFRAPRHPYSRKLFAALPAPDKRAGGLAVIRGQVPSLTGEFRGCRFADRCDFTFARCREEPPPLYDAGNGQLTRCFLFAPEARPEGVGKAQADTSARGETPEPDSSVVSHQSSLLEVSDLKVHFPIRRGIFRHTVGHVRAVDGVTFAIGAGKTLGLVGESGCGKTTVGKGILRLVDPTSGTVLFDGTDLARLERGELRPRRKHVQIIFQDPYASLNPRMRISDILLEGMKSLGVGGDEADRARRMDGLLEQVGLSPAMKSRYPHEFSGGQRQRIAIARALSVEPRLIVCDEPTSALDVSVQAQILNLLKDLQQKRGVAYLFITHNIAVIEFLAHEVAVMYLGRIVERGKVEEVLGNPKHPYTQALLSAVPVIDPAGQRKVIRLQGDLPSPVNPPEGCHFTPRCPRAFEPCPKAYPGSARFTSTHSAACYLYTKA
ncbi:MAG TPA: ABC transporter ATP-binding protein [Burkholderiales bacterium]|nr:ABC transporter ATP-binding protein [Burkholderiales bacterium]